MFFLKNLNGIFSFFFSVTMDPHCALKNKKNLLVYVHKKPLIKFKQFLKRWALRCIERRYSQTLSRGKGL